MLALEQGVVVIAIPRQELSDVGRQLLRTLEGNRLLLGLKPLDQEVIRSKELIILTHYESEHFNVEPKAGLSW